VSTDVPLAPFVQQAPELHDVHWVVVARLVTACRDYEVELLGPPPTAV